MDGTPSVTVFFGLLQFTLCCYKALDAGANVRERELGALCLIPC